MELTEGEDLRLKIRGTGKTMEEAAQAMGFTRRMLYNYFDMEELPDDIREKARKNLNILTFMKSSISQNVPHETASEKSVRRPKIDSNHEEEGITFVPINAQAGYSKKLADPIFTRSLQKLFIPGMPYRGDRFRVFEVEGNSMEPTFVEHLHVLTEKVDQEQWKNIKNYYAYVLITEEGVLIKRVFRKSDKLWVLISDNEDLYPQFLQPVVAVKELWFIKRKLDWEMAPPKRFEIKI